jgi:tetratricopeptide (TPR) repeat protein
MTVRWKPLLILSGLFVVVALGGLLAFTMVRGGGGTESILAKARADRSTGRFEEAEVEFKRAIQVDGRNAAIYQEFAAFYEEWLGKAPAEKVTKLQVDRLTCLSSAAKLAPNLVEPKRMLLQSALDHDDPVESVRWATELLKLEPDDATAHYVIAADRLDESSPNLADVRRHLAHVTKQDPRPIRADWLAARVAQIAKDDAELTKVLTQSRSRREVKGLAIVDATALFRLRALDVQTIDDPTTLSDRVKAVTVAAEALTAEIDAYGSRVARVSRAMEGVQQAIARIKTPDDSALHKELLGLGDQVEAVIESIFRKALAVKGGPDMGVYFSYADHLRFRDNRARCLEVIDEAFKSPTAARQTTGDAPLSLHALAVHAILTDLEDKGRFDRAAPHIKALIDGPNARFRAFGHMYQGQIDIERLNLAQNSDADGANAAESKARSSALSHLKTAASELPDLAEAQARYGVALILCRETELGRVYLQRAARIGNLEPRYQIWAAWAMVHGGYPEYAEPIVDAMLADVEAGRLPRPMAGVLHLVSAEIHQARRSPEELRKAVASYQKAFANGQEPTPAVQLRMAQIELMLERPADALTRLEAMDRAGIGSPSCEMLAVNILRGQKKLDASRDRLAKARAKYPKSSELVSLEAEILVAEKKAEEADRLVAGFLAHDPDNIGLVELRSWILSDALNKTAEARALLVQVADRADRTSPLVRLAQLDIRRRDFEAAALTIAKIRNRWKEAAVGDMLDAQVALARGNTRLASTFYDAALKKDPNNKLVQYWKAQLDGSVDPQGAAKVLESLSKDGSVKEVEDGLSLMSAAQSALANLQLESGDIDGAIAKYETLLKAGSTGNTARDLRWKLVAANVAKKQWPAAKAELEAILGDTASPPSPEERTAAALYFRNNNEEETATRLLDAVLKADPAHPWAVTVQTQRLAVTGKLAEARELVRRGIAASQDKGKIPAAFYLLLAAVENGMPPVSDGLKRALAAVDEGLALQPRSMELVQAKCRLLGLMGDPKAAIAFVESRVKDDPKGPFSRLLIGLHRDARDYAAAERITTDLLKDNPDDQPLSVSLVRLVAAQAIEARGKGDRQAVDALNGRTAALIRDLRTKFATDPAFVQLDCELAVRRGETSRALTLTQEIDRMTPGSPVGALLRAQIFSAQNRTREVAAAYSEALERNPRQPEVRLLLAQTDILIKDFDQALKNARLILEHDPEQPAAILVEAWAMASASGSASQVAANRTNAIEILTALIKKQPALSEAYHLLAQVHEKTGAKDQAVASLRAGLKAVPTDAAGLSIALRMLCEPAGPGKPADPARLDEARALAEEVAGPDKTGALCHAAAVGFHKSAQLAPAIHWSEKAAKLSDARVVHLNFGDILLSVAETTRGAERDAYLTRGIAEFDRVIKEQPTNVEAVNNKAWILHSYRGRSQEALELAEGLTRKVESATLPAEFYDTLGSIQEAVGRSREAEESYKVGLEKSPDLPVLNFHMGRLIAADKARARRASSYLERAQKAHDQLPPEMAAEVAGLVEKVNR